MYKDVGINIDVVLSLVLSLQCLIFIIYLVYYFFIKVFEYWLQEYHDVKRHNKLIILRMVLFQSCLIKITFEDRNANW